MNVSARLQIKPVLPPGVRLALGLLDRGLSRDRVACALVRLYLEHDLLQLHLPPHDRRWLSVARIVNAVAARSCV